ncbi:MAG: PAS domain-containing protein [Acidobacteriota bacterium]|nr:PAS domain-containing protein [Acidobacteriota bacterium]
MASHIFDLPSIDTSASERLLLEDPDPLSWTEAESTLVDLAGAFPFFDSVIEKAAAASLRASENKGSVLVEVDARYRTLVEQIPAVVFMAFLDKGIGEAYVSPQIEQMLGFSQEEWLNDPVRWYQQIHPDDKARWSMEAAGLLMSGQPLKSLYRVLARDGHVVWFHCEAKMVRNDDGQPWFIHGVAFDISELKRAEAAGQEYAERLKFLSRRLMEVQEAERRNIALELHDEIGQVLTGLKLSLEIGTRLPADEIVRSLNQARQLVNELMARVRKLSLDLRPAMLDDLGLLPALLWHFEHYTAQTQVRVHFKHSGLEKRRFTSEVETAAYRLVQEALTNIARHAEVLEATVRLSTHQKTLLIEVEDRGKGFDVDAVLKASETSGLPGMRERAVLLGGQMTVESQPGVGTRLTAQLSIAVSAVPALNENSVKEKQQYRE